MIIEKKETKSILIKFDEIDKFVKDLKDFGLEEGIDFKELGDRDYDIDDPRTIPLRIRFYPQNKSVYVGDTLEICYFETSKSYLFNIPNL